jgi:carbamoyl-phosphate synthase small subunit
MNTATLLLADGSMFEGFSYGAIGTTSGEICFNTGMTGYQEVFTDPSYYGQVIIMNTAHVGNYGTKADDVESDTVKISGLICKNLSEKYNRIQADDDLEQYLIKNNIVAIHGIDTRALVAHIRENGAMNCMISSDSTSIEELVNKLKEMPSMKGLNLTGYVTTKTAYNLGDESSSKKIAVLDFGVKKNILRCMTDRGAYLKVFPASTTFEELEKFSPDAYFISNGPGDPASMTSEIETIKKILDTNKPLFGICLGHQLLALANGIPTYKMHHGHRGLNHPVKNIINGKSEISTQNHGFAVDAEAIKNNTEIEITHVNLNDDTIEGIRIKNKPAFSVQYHPEATPGPHDSRYLFDDFIGMITSSN